MQDTDVRQGHPVEGVVLDHRVDCHILKAQPFSDGKRRIEAVISDDVSRKACPRGQPVGDALFVRHTALVKRRTVGHFEHIRHVARCRCIQNGDMQSVLHDVHDLRDKIPRVQRDGFTGLKIDLHIIFLRKLRDELFQQGDVISGLGDVMSAAEVHPFHPVQILPELVLDRPERGFERIGALFAERVEMDAVHLGKHVRFEIREGHAET